MTGAVRVLGKIRAPDEDSCRSGLDAFRAQRAHRVELPFQFA
jgi:hypothetical protein